MDAMLTTDSFMLSREIMTDTVCNMKIEFWGSSNQD